METALLVKRSPPKLLYPALIVAAICVTLFSLLGIAAMTGHLPQASAGTAANAAESASVNESEDQARSLQENRHGGATRAAPCSNCGVIESIRATEAKGSGSGTGAVIGGIAGAVLGNTMGRGNGRTAMTLIGGGAGAYAGNEIEKNSNRRTIWQTRVRMENGSSRTLSSRHQPEFGVGAKVKLVDGQLVADRIGQ